MTQDDSAREPSFPSILEELLAGVDLGSGRSRWLGDQMMGGSLTQSQMGAALALWRVKGETVAELAGLVDKDEVAALAGSWMERFVGRA